MLKGLKQDVVCLFRNALYGLKQAGLQWNIEVDNVLTRLGLQRSRSDLCIYFAWNTGQLMIISVYVDDFIIASRNTGWIQYIKREMSTYFDVKVLGIAQYCLGLEIHQEPGVITVKQSGYIEDLIKRFNIDKKIDKKIVTELAWKMPIL